MDYYALYRDVYSDALSGSPSYGRTHCEWPHGRGAPCQPTHSPRTRQLGSSMEWSADISGHGALVGTHAYLCSAAHSNFACTPSWACPPWLGWSCSCYRIQSHCDAVVDCHRWCKLISFGKNFLVPSRICDCTRTDSSAT